MGTSDVKKFLVLESRQKLQDDSAAESGARAGDYKAGLSCGVDSLGTGYAISYQASDPFLSMTGGADLYGAALKRHGLVRNAHEQARV